MDYAPLDWMRKKYVQINKKYIYIFMITFIIGFITHFFLLSNKFINNDSLAGTFIGGRDYFRSTMSGGRWAYMFFYWITSGFSMPQVKGVVALLYMSVSVILIIDILKVENIMLGSLLGGIFITFPSVACCFSFTSSIDAYALCFLMAVISVYLLEKGSKMKFFLAVIVLTLSLGFYQSSITFAIALIFIMLLTYALTKQIIVKDFMMRTVRYLFFLALGLGLYLIISKGLLYILDIEASTYRNMDSMTEFSLIGILKGFIYSYAYFVAYYFTTYYTYSIYRIIFNVLATLIAILLIIPLYRKMYEEHNIANMIITCILILLMPIGINSMPLLMGERVETGVHRVMLFSLIFLYFFYAKLIDINLHLKAYQGWGKKKIIQWLGILPLIVAIHTGFLICNQAYDRMYTRYENIYGYLNRVAARIEGFPEWNHDIPIFFAYPAAIFNHNYDVEIEPYDKLKRMFGTDLYPWYSSDNIALFMEVYLHFNVEEINEEERKEIYKDEEFIKMPIFPAEGSIRMIDNVLVVKMDEEGGI